MLKIYQGDSYQILQSIVETCERPVIISDPPFNINYHYRTYKDKMPHEEYVEKMRYIFSMCPSVVINYSEMLYELAIAMGKPPLRVVSWVYNSNTARQHRDIAFFDIFPDFKKVIQPYKNPNDKRIKERIAKGILGGKLYDWWNVNQVKSVSKAKTSHPRQMPLEVMKNIVGILPEDITVIDPFMGSGTTGKACKELNRDFIGIELDEEYCKIAENRLQVDLERKS